MFNLAHRVAESRRLALSSAAVSYLYTSIYFLTIAVIPVISNVRQIFEVVRLEPMAIDDQSEISFYIPRRILSWQPK